MNSILKKNLILKMDCSICYETIKEKALVDCNHNFCHSCIQKWKHQKMSCPLCREILPPVIRFCTRKKMYGEDSSNLLRFWKEVQLSPRFVNLMQNILKHYRFIYPLKFLRIYQKELQKNFVQKILKDEMENIIEEKTKLCENYQESSSFLSSSDPYATSKNLHLKRELKHSIEKLQDIHKKQAFENALQLFNHAIYQYTNTVFREFHKNQKRPLKDKTSIFEISFCFFEMEMRFVFDQEWDYYFLDSDPLDFTVLENETLESETLGNETLENDPEDGINTLFASSLEQSTDTIESINVSQVEWDVETEILDDIIDWTTFHELYKNTFYKDPYPVSYFTNSSFKNDFEWFFDLTEKYYFSAVGINTDLACFFEEYQCLIDDILIEYCERKSKSVKKWENFQNRYFSQAAKNNSTNDESFYKNMVRVCVGFIV